MPLARNDKGEFVVLGDDGQWSPAKVAVNPETGARLVHDGSSWIPEPTPSRPTGERIMRGVSMPAQGFNESVATTIGALPDAVGWGLRQVGLPSSTPGAYTDAARKAIGAVTSLGGLLPKPPQPETSTEKALYAAGQGAGDAASIAIPATVAAKLAPAGGMVSRLGEALMAQPGAQVASGAAGRAVQEATDSPALGVLASVATPALMGMATRAVKPIRPDLSPETQRLIQVAEDEGIPLTAGQATGSKALKYLEGTFDTLPLTSGPQDAIRQAQRTALNRASLAKSGTVADAATPDVLNAARSRIGGEIGDIARRNVLEITPEVEASLNGIADDVTRNYSADVAKPVIARINEVLNHVEGRTIPGDFYKNLDSQIGRQIKAVDSGVQREALGKVRETLREAMDASITPADQEAWQQARRQYANMMVTARATGGAGEGAATGNVSPLALRQAVDQSTGRGYAFGQGDQNDLARVGQAFLRPAPDSGTPGRSFWQNLLTYGVPGAAGGATAYGASPLTGALTAVGAIAGPRVAQSIYNTPAMQEYFKRGIPRLAGAADLAPELNRPLVAALLGQRAKDVLPGRDER